MIPHLGFICCLLMIGTELCVSLAGLSDVVCVLLGAWHQRAHDADLASK